MRANSGGSKLTMGQNQYYSTNMARDWFWPNAICGLSLLLVLALSWGFFSRFSSFPFSIKTNISKFQFDQDEGLAWEPAETDVASSLNVVIYILLNLFIPSHFMLGGQQQQALAVL